MIVFCLCGQSSSECWSKQSPVWDISVIGRELNSIGKGGCGRIEGTLSKCGANHVFALDDAEHLPTPSAHPSSPQLHIAPRLGIFLCVACSQAAELAAAALAAICLCVAPAGCGE